MIWAIHSQTYLINGFSIPAAPIISTVLNAKQISSTFEFVSDSTYVEFGSIQIASGGFLVTFCGAGVTSMAFSYCDFPLGRIETTKALYDEYGGKPHFVTHHASSKVKCVPDTHKA